MPPPKSLYRLIQVPKHIPPQIQKRDLEIVIWLYGTPEVNGGAVCFVLQDDYIPYPSIDEVGALCCTAA